MKTDTEILQQAIDTAEHGGWDNSMGYSAMDVTGIAFLVSKVRPPQYVSDPIEILFDHEFASAIWGDEPYGIHNTPNSIWHLQGMAAAKDRFAYLRLHLV